MLHAHHQHLNRIIACHCSAHLPLCKVTGNALEPPLLSQVYLLNLANEPANCVLKLNL